MPVSAFLTGLFNKINTVNNLKTALSSRFYLGNAPQSATYPYMVYHLINNSPDQFFGGTIQEEYTVQFDLVSQSTSPSELTTLIGYLEALIDNTILTVAGYTHFKCFREMSTMEFFFEENLWVSNHRYCFLLQKS